MINKEELQKGYNLCIDGEISDLEFLYEYVFKARYNDVEKIVMDVDSLMNDLISDNFSEKEVITIEAEGSSINKIIDLYDNQKLLENRDNVLKDLLD